MDLFPNGGFVRLQSRAHRGKYVHANGDWEGVSLRPLGAVQPLEAVWRVEYMAVNQGEVAIYLQLQNAAYGRYLSLSFLEAGSGHRGRRAVQSDRLLPPNHVNNDYDLWWRVERVEPNQDYLRLRLADSNFDLRANGRYLTWNTGVTIDEELRPRLTTMMQWTVEVVPPSPVPLPLPVAPPQPQQIVVPALYEFICHSLFESNHGMEKALVEDTRKTRGVATLFDEWAGLAFILLLGATPMYE